MRWIWAVAALLAVGLCVGACSTLLPAVKLDPAAAPAAPPPILGALEGDPAVATQADWQTRRAPLLRRLFAERIYGPYPPHAAPARRLTSDAIAYPPLADHAVVEQWSVAVGDGDRPLHFNMIVVLPRAATGPVPVIMMENFCGNRLALDNAPATVAGPLTKAFPGCTISWAQPLVRMIFGDRINAPPYEAVLARGYGLAMFYAGDVVADDAQSARAGLVQLYGDGADRAGAIAVWAWLYSQAYDTLAADPRIDARRIAAWGHSRNGKAALLAAAMDPRIAAVIAHQSGRGGAALNHSARGEQVHQMMSEYDYWFPPQFAQAGAGDASFDQHQLLALIAPRPVLLGNGARDAWADPLAAWSAAEAATPAYRLFGVEGIAQPDMRTPNSAARIQYYTRPGLHGVTSGDWNVFLDFLDAQMGPAPPPSAPPSSSRGQ